MLSCLKVDINEFDISLTQTKTAFADTNLPVSYLESANSADRAECQRGGRTIVSGCKDKDGRMRCERDNLTMESEHSLGLLIT